jgi:Uma2 family endonuclease
MGELRPVFGLGRPDNWRILLAPELHAARDVLVPDIAGWKRERLPALPEKYFTSMPDWICEVLSSSTASIIRTKKLSIYARERVRHAWLVDPMARTLEVLGLENGRWTIIATASDLHVIRAEPFDAIELDLSLLWEEEPPAESQP